MAGAGDVENAQVALANGAIEVGVDEVEPGSGAEVAEESRLDVLGHKRFPEERVVQQVHLPDREVVGGAPVRVDELELGVLKDCLAHVVRDGVSLSTLASARGQDAETAQVEREREDQRARPEVHGIEEKRLLVSDEVEDEPDSEPDECHGVLLF